MALIDTGATHNFIDEKFVTHRGLHTEEHRGFKVMVADGFKIDCTKKIFNLQLRLGDYDMTGDFFVVNIGDQDMVLGMNWMKSLVEFTFNLQKMEMRFEVNGKKIVLRGLSAGRLQVVSLKRMQSFFRHDQVQWVVEFRVIPEVT